MLRAALNVQSSDAVVAIADRSEPRVEQQVPSPAPISKHKSSNFLQHAALQSRVAELEAQVQGTAARSRRQSVELAEQL